MPKLLAMSQAVSQEKAIEPVESSGRISGVSSPVARLGAIVVSHGAVDVYSAFVPPILGVLELRAGLTSSQTAWLLGVGSLCSGVTQPVSAWISDHLDSRLFGALGLVLAAVCLSSIGMAENFTQLLLLYGFGMLGVGIFHPVGASCVGQIAESALSGRRSLGVSIFFIAGMAGGATGAIASARLASETNGFTLLGYLMIPGILIAAILHLAIRKLPHRHEEHKTIKFEPAEIRLRWEMVSLLYFGNAMRFTVNMAMVYLFVRWAQAVAATTHPEFSPEELVAFATPITGNVNAFTILGMALGGMGSGILIKQGREKLPLILVPILMAPVIALFPYAGIYGGYALAILAGVGFASMIPVTLGLAQRLLPHRTSLASGLMLGGAWAIAVAGPRLAEWCIDTESGLGFSLGTTFLFTGILLAVSGLIGLFLKQSLLEKCGRVSVSE